MLTWTHHVSLLIPADMAHHVSLRWKYCPVFSYLNLSFCSISRHCFYFQELSFEPLTVLSFILGETEGLQKMEEVPKEKDTMIMLETIMTITNCSEEEAVSTLLDCNNDPHEAILELIEKGEFQEVKYRHKKKKEMRDDCIKDAMELCPPFPHRTSNLTRGRVGISQSASSESSFIRDPQKTNYLLLTQTKLAPDEDLYPCFACPAFNPFTLDKLKVHNKEDHPLCKVKCSVCYNVFDTNRALLTHKKSLSHGFQSQAKAFRCVHCNMGKTYWSVAELDKHTTVHGRFKYRCNLCKNLFATETARSVHKPDCACIRPLWRHYFQNTRGLIFVIDSNDRNRVSETSDELHRMLSEEGHPRRQRHGSV